MNPRAESSLFCGSQRLCEIPAPRRLFFFKEIRQEGPFPTRPDSSEKRNKRWAAGISQRRWETASPHIRPAGMPHALAAQSQTRLRATPGNPPPGLPDDPATHGRLIDRSPVFRTGFRIPQGNYSGPGKACSLNFRRAHAPSTPKKPDKHGFPLGFRGRPSRHFRFTSGLFHNKPFLNLGVELNGTNWVEVAISGIPSLSPAIFDRC